MSAPRKQYITPAEKRRLRLEREAAVRRRAARRPETERRRAAKLKRKAERQAAKVLRVGEATIHRDVRQDGAENAPDRRTPATRTRQASDPPPPNSIFDAPYEVWVLILPRADVFARPLVFWRALRKAGAELECVGCEAVLPTATAGVLAFARRESEWNEDVRPFCVCPNCAGADDLAERARRRFQTYFNEQFGMYRAVVELVTS